MDVKPSSYLEPETLNQFVILNTLTKLFSHASDEQKLIYFSVAKDLLNNSDTKLLEASAYSSNINLAGADIEKSKDIYKTAVAQIADSMEIKVLFNPSVCTLLKNDNFVLKIFSNEEIEKYVKDENVNELKSFLNSLNKNPHIIVVENPMTLNRQAKWFLSQISVESNTVIEYASDNASLKNAETTYLKKLETFGFKDEINQELNAKIEKIRNRTNTSNSLSI